jgi:DNA-binding transcriptional MerR regulator
MGAGMTIDELARQAGTTGRQVRALQTQGLLARPTLVGRTGYYRTVQLDRLRAILRLQREGFSLAGIGVLLRSLDAGVTLERVIGLTGRTAGDPVSDRDRVADHNPAGDGAPDGDDDFAGWPDSPNGRLLAVIPTTLIDLSMAS